MSEVNVGYTGHGYERQSNMDISLLSNSENQCKFLRLWGTFNIWDKISPEDTYSRGLLCVRTNVSNYGLQLKRLFQPGVSLVLYFCARRCAKVFLNKKSDFWVFSGVYNFMDSSMKEFVELKKIRNDFFRVFAHFRLPFLCFFRIWHPKIWSKFSSEEAIWRLVACEWKKSGPYDI